MDLLVVYISMLLIDISLIKSNWMDDVTSFICSDIRSMCLESWVNIKCSIMISKSVHGGTRSELLSNKRKIQRFC